ncbi:MAG: GNAT family N-acetyltransferase [Conexivisphaerales archaeon]
MSSEQRLVGEVVLKDGSTVHVREVVQEDKELLREFLNSLSSETIANRFFGIGIDREAALSVLIPKSNDYALVALREGRIIAHACYHITSDKRAEAAVVVADSYQGKGLGTILLGQLVQHAERKGILVFDAYVQPENYRMISVLRKLGYQVSLKAEPGAIKASFTISSIHELESVFDQLEAKAASAAVRSFLFPRGVAVIGASRDRTSIGGELFWNIIESGYKGAVYPVNANADVVQSIVAYKSVLDCPGPVDVALICVPARFVLDVAKECYRKGVKGLVVISSGFAEVGGDGIKLQRELVSLCNNTGMRLIGPNCMGIINTNPEVSLNAQFAPYKPLAGKIGFLSQSGALGIAVIEHATRLGLGLSSFISVGNKADISGNDLIQYWENDEDTEVILLYLESFGNPRKFARIARRVTKKKPIIAVKGGRSAAGFRATQSHTGAMLAASDVTVDALFKQTGVIRVDVLSEMFDVAALLSTQPLPKGKRVGIITNAGGAGILASDACENYGLEVPEYSQETQQMLRSFLRAEAGVRNPVDMIASATPEDYGRAIRAVAEDKLIDSLIVIFIPPISVSASDVAKVILQEAKRINKELGKPVLSVFMATHGISELLSDGETKIPSYPFPEAAAGALARAAQYSEWVSREEGRRVVFSDINRERAASIVAAALGKERHGPFAQSASKIGKDPESSQRWLTPEETYQLLECYGIPVAKLAIAKSLDEVGEMAKKFEGNVVLKAISPRIIHKTEAGAVRLDVKPEDAKDAASEMTERLRASGIEPEGFLIQQMVKGAFETFVGVTHDQSFGPVIACGAGGILVELMKDISVRIAPLTDREADEMIKSLKSYPILTGYRGGARYDVDALKEVILRVSALIDDIPEIAEMDLNPVMLLQKGAYVVDARVRVAEMKLPMPFGAKRVD